MSVDLILIFMMPVACLGFIIWMIAAGYAKTDGIPPETEPNPYPERLDTLGRWMLGIFTGIFYIALAVNVGPLGAAIAFAALFLFDLLGAFVWTVAQQLFRRPIAAEVPFGTRLFRNSRDFYLRIIGGIAHGV